MSYSADPARVHVLKSKILHWVGGLEPEGARPCKHIFVGEAHEAVAEDGLPKFDGFRDGQPTTTEMRLRYEELAREGGREL